MKPRMQLVKFLFIVFCILTFLPSCLNSGVYSFKLFTYPPTSTPTDKTWLYWGSIDMWEPHDNIGTVTITINVEDKATKKTILNDKFTIEMPLNTIDPCTKWDTFDTLVVMFTQSTRSGCCDDSGAVHFMERLYVYDSSKVQFVVQ
jgi:hypothetical protein